MLVPAARNGASTPKQPVARPSEADLSHPHILRNSGGVVVSYFEWGVQGFQRLFWEEEEVTSREYQLWIVLSSASWREANVKTIARQPSR
ncbi:hypothetical protein [Bradyrhizobium sp. 87]|uniref:hypothetical protein n=1 Tax=unclassified Bradyrhizobium TaxID=2631580 RepID=UPI003211E7ED